VCVYVCEFGNRTSDWHVDDEKYDDGGDKW
jgi:hypothetical protein